MTQVFSKFRVACNHAKKVKPFEGSLLAFDPGQTTGWAFFRSSEDDIFLEEVGQADTWPMANCIPNLTYLYNVKKPLKVVHEVYRVYSWKTEDHTWSDVPTLHVIGCIETLCIQQHITYESQTAQIAKNFCTDERLKDWGMYAKGQRHARDAIRHGCYYLLFGSSASQT